MVRRLAALAPPNGQGAPANTAIDRRKEGGGDVYEKSLEMRRAPDLSVPGGGRWALLGAPESVRQTNERKGLPRRRLDVQFMLTPDGELEIQV
jgi:hypothetical protein